MGMGPEQREAWPAGCTAAALWGHGRVSESGLGCAPPSAPFIFADLENCKERAFLLRPPGWGGVPCKDVEDGEIILHIILLKGFSSKPTQKIKVLNRLCV